MSLLNRFASVFRSWFRREQLDQELDEVGRGKDSAVNLHRVTS